MRKTILRIFVIVSVIFVALVLTPLLFSSSAGWAGFLFQSPPYPPPPTDTPTPVPTNTPVPPPQEPNVVTLVEEELVFEAEGETLPVTIILDQPYPLAVFRIEWPGSTYSSKLIYEGEELNPEDENVEVEVTPTTEEWRVTDAPAGEYTLEVTAVDISTLGEIVNVSAYGFLPGGEVSGSIRGVVFEDANGNGERDAGEKGVSGAMVTIASSGDWSATFTSGDDGAYAPVGLNTAYYSAELTVPEGYVATGPTRYEGIGVGIHGIVITGIDFAIASATTPAELPAAGAGGLTPGTLALIALVTIVFVIGVFFVFRGGMKEA